MAENTTKEAHTKMKKTTGKRTIWPATMLLAAVMMVTAVSGCSLLPFGRPSAGPGEDPITPGPGQGEVALILYFADSDAMYLVPEERVVTVGGESYARADPAGDADTGRHEENDQDQDAGVRR